MNGIAVKYNNKKNQAQSFRMLELERKWDIV